MKKIYLFLLMLLIFKPIQAQLDSVFWFVAPEVSKGGYSNMDLDRPIKINLVSFNAYPVNVTISQPANSLFSPIVDVIPANGYLTIDLTSRIDIIENKPANSVLPYGLLIQSAGLVSAYYEVCLDNANPEIYSLKGKNALGTNFMIPGQTECSNGNNPLYTPIPLNRIDIVATKNNTVVSITPSKSIVGHVANVTFTKNLNAGETYSCAALGQLPAHHLEGTIITSNLPIAVTITDDLLKHPMDGGADLVGEQIVPIDLIGQEYIAVKGSLNSNADKVYVLATVNNTSIYLNGNTVPVATINKGQTHVLTFPTNAIYFTSSNPVYAFQLTGIGFELGGTILPSIKCTGSKQVKYKRTLQKTLKFNICVHVSGINSFLVNGNSSIITASDFLPVQGTNNQWYYTSKDILISIISQNSLAVITNTVDFHIGVLEGDESWGTSYAFFSDYRSQYTTNIHDTTCLNNDYKKHGFNISADKLQTVGTFEYQYNIPNPTGCDTLVVLKLYVTPKDTFNIFATICEGNIYSQNGFNETESGTYTQNLKNSSGCDSLVILNLLVSKDTTRFDITICEGETYQENGFNHSVSGTYTQNLKNSSGCDSLVILNLNVVKPPDTVFISAAICEGETYNQNGFNHSTSGTYSRNLLNYAGCDSTVILNLTVNPIPDIEIFAVTDRFCEEDFILLEIITNGDSFLWNTGSSENPLTITKSGIYSATAYLGNCKDTASYTVDYCPCEMWLPNIFTPNNDGLNDVFIPVVHSNLASFTMHIYDRWGQVIYVTHSFTAWDGTANGRHVAAGVYYCTISYSCAHDPTKILHKHGSVTLVR